MNRLLQKRFRISVQLYIGIGGAVVLTIAASLVGWYSFDRVGDVQSRVNEGTVPALAAAFEVARYSGELVAAGPRLASAGNTEGFVSVEAGIDAAHGEFRDQLTILEQSDALEQSGAGVGDLELMRNHADDLIENLGSISDDKPVLLALADCRVALGSDLERLQQRLDDIVIPAIDDQLFYTMTGYRELGEPPTSESERLSEDEFNRFRYLSELQTDGNIALQLLGSAFNVSGASDIEPLREQFESAGGRIERSLAAIEGSEVHGEVASIFSELFQLGLGVDSGFDMLAQQLRLEKDQRDLLSENRDIAVALVGEVNYLVAAAESSVAAATESSAQSFLTGRTLLLGISAVSIGGALLIAWLFVGRVLLRRLQMLSDRMRGMAAGDLETQLEIGGRDEISDMAAALEVFRRHALEVQRLNLVEQLAEELQGKNDELESVLAELHRAQDQIVIREKLAALGELTAGVAHEIRNPLNFVKNFSEGSEDLLLELQETLEENADRLDESQQELIRDISTELTGNMQRIRSHGERANRIVQDMLMMGSGSGQQQLTDINRLLDQNTRLAYHSARASDPDFQLDFHEDLDSELGEIAVVPQDLARVFLNIVGNACDATAEKRMAAGLDDPYRPTLWLTTRRGEGQIEIRIRDNGSGIPEDLVEKVFNPFFTTKPTDRGTGLGLAISNDIVRQHGGTIRVDSEPGEYTEMIVRIPVAGSGILVELEDQEAPAVEGA